MGWLGTDKIGKDANIALFLTIQHTDKLSTMEKYFPIMKEATKNGNLDKAQMAYLIDRVELIIEKFCKRKYWQEVYEFRSN